VMEAMPRATLVCNRKCEAALSKHYDTSSWKVRTVAEGDAIALGKRTLRFIETPMVHWPESMFTYVPQQKLLFSMDAFGQHYAASKRFDDEVSPSTLIEEAKAYYANIVMPYGRAVATCLEKVAPLGVEMIAPAHGLIWRSRVAEILSAYRAWSAGRPACKVVVIYDTMWESTARMAEAILEGASQPGVKTSLIHVRRSTLARIATTVLDAAGMAFGSSTLNREMMPMAAAVLTYLKGLGPAGKFAVAFGSYGWGRGGAEAVHRQLEAMQCELLGEPIRSQYRPTAEVLGQCRAAGRQLAEKAREMAGQNEVRGLDAEGPAAAQR